MRLKKIEIHGFKSFADKTEFDVGKGVTCLVGPNGCGKSNVVDALKWSLGEQRASALRGDSMADVIFKGNGNRPAMSFAEVTLVFDNEQGELPIDLPEVAVTRRLLRTGDSEYLLNRQPVRLKDVRELFVDTGLGANAYAVLEQGKIDAVLRANPVDRRALFEEAAGIQRFRLRKKEAARKLEKVDQNLLRVADLLAELEKRERSLKVQAGRARSYQQLTARLTELKTVQFLAAGADMAKRYTELTERLEAARTEDAASETALTESSTIVEARERETQERRDRAAEQRTREAQARAELEAARSQSAATEQRREESIRSAEDRELRANELESEITRRNEEVVAHQREAESLTGEITQARAIVETRRAALQTAEREEQERNATIEKMRRESLEAAQRELNTSNRLTAIETRARGHRQTRERLVRREAEIAGMLERVRLESSQIASDLHRLGLEQEEQIASLERSREELKARRDREHQLRVQIAELQAERAAKAARRETLAQVIERMEGVDEGSKRLLKAAKDQRDHHRGVRGLFGELLNVPRDRARAVDAALGPLAGAVVVETVADLKRSIDFLRDQSKGPATFLVLEKAMGQLASEGPGNALLAGMELPTDLTALAHAVLGAARVVKDESELLESLGSGLFVVTEDGMRLDRSGAFQDRPQKRSIGFVERKAQRDELSGELKEIEDNLRRFNDEEAKLSGEIAEWTAIVAEAEKRRREVESGIVQTRSASERLRDRAQIFRRELKVSARERFDLEREELRCSQQRAETASELEGQRRLREETEARRTQLVAERAERQEALQQLIEAAAQATRDVVRVEERAKAIASELSVLSRGRDEFVRARAQLVAERESLLERAEKANVELTRLAEIVSTLTHEVTGIAEAIAQLEASVEESRQLGVAARQESLVAAERRESARHALHRLEIEERELSLGQTNLRSRAQEEISLDLDSKLGEFDVGQAPPIDQVTVEISELRDRISRLGNVNLDAIHELEEVEQRLQFLTKERADLDASRKSLEDTIKELDAISRDKFMETFEIVRGHFREMFRKLFHGGRADIMLAEGADVLEAGVEIIAGPPGKDPRSITLLSGGERTMTAVGLLFALFKAKPAPVAVLDEVDAALDEANTERFCSLLAEFIGPTQFLIVTHSKRTMSYADVIFGVTMQENGVSKRIAIRLDDVEKHEHVA